MKEFLRMSEVLREGVAKTTKKSFPLMNNFSTRQTVTSKMCTNKSHLNRKLETRNCYVGGNSEHSDIHCAHNTVASSTLCRNTFITERLGIEEEASEVLHLEHSFIW